MKKLILALIILAFVSCKKSSGDSDSDSPLGVWQRYDSPKGYQTDLAIDNIKGEPANRVYMCEHPGSPSAGMYKGYITGNTIKWDAVHGLPNAEFKKEDGLWTLYFGVGARSDAGKYKKGVWTNTCGKLENTTKKIAVGLSSSAFPGRTITNVSIENINCPLTVLNTGVTAPDCSTSSFITTPATSANADYYKVKITYMHQSVDQGGAWVSSTDESVIFKSQLTGECNRFKVDDPAGRLALSQIQ